MVSGKCANGIALRVFLHKDNFVIEEV